MCHSESRALWEETIVRSGICERKGGIGESKLRRIEVGVCEGFSHYFSPCNCNCTCCLRVSGRVMGVEVSHDVAVITEVKKKLNVV